MKGVGAMRLFGLALVAVLLVGCSSAGDELTPTTTPTEEAVNTETETATATPTEEATETPAGGVAEGTGAVGDSFGWEGQFVLTLLEWRAVTDAELGFFGPDPGFTVYAADVEACTGPSLTDEVTVNPFDFQVQMGDNSRIDSGIIGLDPGLGHTVLGPDDCVRGWVSFELPTDAPQRTLNYAPSLGRVLARWSLE